MWSEIRKLISLEFRLRLFAIGMWLVRASRIANPRREIAPKSHQWVGSRNIDGAYSYLCLKCNALTTQDRPHSDQPLPVGPCPQAPGGSK